MKRVLKVFVSWIALLSFVLMILEGMSFGVYRLVFGKNIDVTELGKLRQSLLTTEEEDLQAQPQEVASVVHPYLGYVYDPGGWGKKKHDGLKVSPFGFIDDNTAPVLKRAPNRVIIGIFGGSVALWASTPRTWKVMRGILEQIPEMEGKDLVVVRAALGGYKQPQQLMALNYILAQGGEFDYVVNIDGVNEAVQAPINLRAGVHPFFPMNWKSFSSALPSSEFLETLALVKSGEADRRVLAQLIQKHLWRFSFSANLIWSLVDRAFENKLQASRMSLVGLSASSKTGFVSSGPPWGKAENGGGQDEQEMGEILTQLWAESSELLHQLCVVRGCKYLHVLQPSQYTPGLDKKWTLTELEKKVNADDASKHYIGLFYPKFQSRGKELEKRGIEFLDLSLLFKESSEDIFVDSCCHLSPRGNELMGQQIARRLQVLMASP